MLKVGSAFKYDYYFSKTCPKEYPLKGHSVSCCIHAVATCGYRLTLVTKDKA